MNLSNYRVTLLQKVRNELSTSKDHCFRDRLKGQNFINFTYQIIHAFNKTILIPALYHTHFKVHFHGLIVEGIIINFFFLFNLENNSLRRGLVSVLIPFF